MLRLDHLSLDCFLAHCDVSVGSRGVSAELVGASRQTLSRSGSEVIDRVREDSTNLSLR